jgi:elongation factor P--(R)-beta-lysine ligase
MNNDEGGALTPSVLKTRHGVLRAIRQFFHHRGYLEIETPHLVKAAPSDPYIEPLKVYVGDKGPYYLHTSPEIGMKKALACGVERIFEICKVFRVEEFEEHHSVEFTMVEWYRPGTYLDAMGETEDLVRHVGQAICSTTGPSEYVRQPWRTYELRGLCVELVGFDPLPLSFEDLRRAMTSRGYGELRSDAGWADLFFRLLVQEVEPRLQAREKAPYFIKDWPASLTAMARRKDDLTVERFELYMKDLEIANGYTELLDPTEQRKRIVADNETRRSQGKDAFPPDESFLQSIGRISGPVSGVSIGVDRLIMVLLGKERISEVLVDRITL